MSLFIERLSNESITLCANQKHLINQESILQKQLRKVKKESFLRHVCDNPIPVHFCRSEEHNQDVQGGHKGG